MLDYDEQAEVIIRQGKAADDTDDDIKGNMVKSGIPFSQVEGMHTRISVRLGYLTDTQVVEATLRQVVSDTNWASLRTYEQVQDAYSAVNEVAPGASRKKVAALVRQHCRKFDVTLPQPMVGTISSRITDGSVVSQAILSLLRDNPRASRQDAFDAIFPLTGGQHRYKSTLTYISNQFVLARAAANGMTFHQTTVALSTLPAPGGGPESVAA